MTKTLKFDLADNKPKYQGMVDQLESAIGQGVWQVGERLPSNRELASRFGVTIGTVSKAMSEAVRRGIIDTRVGSGTYIRRPSGASGGSAASVSGSRAIDLSLNVLPVSPVRELLAHALSMQVRADPDGVHDLFAYAEVRGEARYLVTAAQWLTTLGTPTAPERVVLTGGGHHGLVAAFQLLTKPGDAVLCDALCYTGFQRIARLRGVRLVAVASDAEGMRPDSLEEAARISGARVLLVNPVLQNPLATVQPPARRLQIATLCRRLDLQVIEDAVNVPLADPGTPSLAAHMPERTLHLTGWSKSLAPGFRLGYACMPDAWRDGFQDAVVGVQWFAPGYYADLLEVMQAEGLVVRCIEAQRAEASLRRALLQEWLPQAVMEGIGYHAWLPCGPTHPAAELCELASRQGVSLSSGHHFAADPAAPAPDGVRISLGHCEDRAELRRALAIVSGFVAQAPSLQRPVSQAPAV